MNLAEKMHACAGLAALVPDRLCRTRVDLALVDRVEGVPGSYVFEASASGFHEKADDPDAAVDQLLAKLQARCDEYLADLETGLAKQTAAVRAARAKLQPAILVRADATELPESRAV